MKFYLNKIDDVIVKSIILLILIDITYLLLLFAHIKIFNEDPGIIFDKKYIINPSDTVLVHYNIKKHMVNNTSNENIYYDTGLQAYCQTGESTEECLFWCYNDILILENFYHFEPIYLIKSFSRRKNFEKSILANVEFKTHGYIYDTWIGVNQHMKLIIFFSPLVVVGISILRLSITIIPLIYNYLAEK